MQQDAPSPARAIPPEGLAPHVDLSALGEALSTAEVRPERGHVGQDRALRSLRLGVRLRAPGYNVYVSGLMGGAKADYLREVVLRYRPELPVPPDRLYCFNFADPDRPLALTLPAGQGRRLRQDLRDLLQQLRRTVPEALQQEGIERRKAALSEKYQAELGRLQEERPREIEGPSPARPSADAGTSWTPPDELLAEAELRTPSVLPREEVAREEESASRIARLFLRRQQQLLEALAEEVEEAVRMEVATFVDPLFERLRVRYAAEPRVTEFLDRLQRHALAALESFASTEGRAPRAFPLGVAQAAPPRYLEFEVNLAVDNAEAEGAPVLVEQVPTYGNLFGGVDRAVDPTGKLVTDFTQIKSGALLRASGGYLLFDLEDAVAEPLVWKTLKRVLRNGRLEIDSSARAGLPAVGGIEPEPVQIDTRLIVYGTPHLFHRLRRADPEFGELFKVVAEFDHEAELGPEAVLGYARRLAYIAQTDGLPHFDREAVAEILRFGCRHVEHQGRVEALLDHVDAVAREAAHHAAEAGEGRTSGAHVRLALEHRGLRAGRREAKIRELIRERTLLLEVDGSKVGQVNGLVVLSLGDHAFGVPSRVTATVGRGRAGVLSVDREARLSGPVHDKGTLILAGYLQNRFGREKPLAFTASLAFEQSYAGVEGDSASSTELYAILSQLGGLPLRQDLAVTGSVNQSGELQAIGGVNEKVEGFFGVCRVVGLTGTQGVIIPEANARHLVLHPEVIEAVRAGSFHVYAARTVEAAMELLTGVAAGPSEDADSLFGRVRAGLAGLEPEA